MRPGFQAGFLRFGSLLLLVLVSLACSLGQPHPELVEATPPAASLPTVLATAVLTGTGTVAVESPTPPPPMEAATPFPETPTPAPAAPLPPAPTPCSEGICTSSGYFLLARPVAPPGRNTITSSDRFGSYGRQRQDANHGVSFLNSSGTVVQAAAEGVVTAAGDDSSTVYARNPNFYGNLVILKHNLPGFSQPVYTLYAHLSQVSVQLNEQVSAGQEIGRVGSSGAVRGSTLHFEVRLGENTYEAARNPELWLAPLSDESGQAYGALAGRVLDGQGNFLVISNILVERLGAPGQPAVDQIYLKTYADQRLAGLSPWEESFAAGDLRAGSYQVSFWYNGFQQQVVQVSPGQLTFVVFRVQ